MKNVEIKNSDIKLLKRNLDAVAQYVIDKKITSPYLNHGIIRNSRILLSEMEAIEEAVPQELKDLETKIYKLGQEEIAKLPEKELAEFSLLPQEEQVNKTFEKGLALTTPEELEQRLKLKEDYNKFLNLKSDIQLYNIYFESLAEVDLELPYWDMLDAFIKIKP